LTASELQQMTGRAGRRGRDNVGFVVAAPGVHQDPQRIAELLKARPDPLVSQFRATYTTLLNLLDAYENFAQVREIVERSFAHREAALEITRLQKVGTESEQRIQLKLEEAGCNLTVAAAVGFERLVSARTRLQNSKPQTRAEVLHRWLDEVVQPGRIVGIGRTGRRFVIITEKRGENVRGIREDGRTASFALPRIGRVYSPTFRLTDESIIEAFDEIRTRGKDLMIPEPRLSDTGSEENEALNVINDRLDSMLPGELGGEEKLRCTQVLWELLDDAENLERSTRMIERLRDEVWEPFEQRARVLATFGYLDYTAEKVTERGRWLADLHVDRPLLVGEALEAGLFNALEFHRLAGVMAALTADGDRDYGEIELEDALVTALAQFEDVGFKVATEEGKLGVETAPELNFSAAGAAALWASGAEWSKLVHETRAEEGDLFRMLSRTGEGLVQIAQLKNAHPEAARIAAIAADAILREPVR
jgi:superfamily II RNA helicase